MFYLTLYLNSSILVPNIDGGISLPCYVKDVNSVKHWRRSHFYDRRRIHCTVDAAYHAAAYYVSITIFYPVVWTLLCLRILFYSHGR